MTTGPFDDRRAHARNAADAPATIAAIGGRAVEARLVDVSAGGAMLVVADGFRRGEDVVMSSRGLDLLATVAWVTPDHCGLRFHRRLHLGEVALLTRRGRRALVANG